MARQKPEDPDKSIMDALMSRLSERQLARMQAPNVSRDWSRKQIQDAFIETFELVGGVPRLALWANDPANYKDFLQLLMKLAPKEQMAEKTGQAIVYQSMVPRSDLIKDGSEASEGDFVEIDGGIPDV